MSLRACPLILLVVSALACRETRSRGERPIRFDQVEPALANCTPCHDEADAQAGVRLGSYYQTLGCLSDGTPLTQANDPPLLRALELADHAQLLTPAEHAELERWLSAGAPGRTGFVHGPDILDPRSEGWHGRLASEQSYTALRDADADTVCGRCHDGAPVRPEGVRYPAPGAPSCTSCHTARGGVFACTTCHGSDDHAYPPRDACYFPTGFAHDAHSTHLTSERVRTTALTCDTCHELPSEELFAGTHADGKIDVVFSSEAGPDAEFDRDTGTCTVACHARGGRRPEPTFHQALSLTCNGCHLSPPADHYPGTCDTCHVEMGQSASSLTPGSFHLDGKVELGNGDGTCGACHGRADDPWPLDGVHRAHRDTRWTAEIACSTCHAVPEQVRAEGHMNGEVAVSFSARARHGSAEPSFDATSKRCDNVACHGGALAAPSKTAPIWRASEEPFSCLGCHQALPPSPPHIQQETCSGSLCHGDEVRGAAPAFGITENGRALHIDGVVQAATR